MPRAPVHEARRESHPRNASASSPAPPVTSFSVGVTARVSALALKRGLPVFSIDPAGLQPARHIDVLAERAEELLPRVVASLP